MPINGDGGNNTLTGNVFVNTINGFGGNDTIDGRDGADTLNGGSGNDIFRYISAGHLDAGETVNGGSGHDELLMTVAGFYNFGTATLNSIEEVEFGGGDGTTARFNSSQIGSGLSATAVIDGYSVAGINDALQILMDTSSVNLSNMVFQQWTEADDHVYVYGSAANNSITGSDVDDNIYGSAGNDDITGGIGEDRLYGEAGDDEFFYTSVAHLASGEVIDGGVGLDELELGGSGTYNLGNATLTSIERIKFNNGQATHAQLNSSQFGTGLSATATIDGYSGAGVNNNLSFIINENSGLYLDGLTFVDWVEADDQVLVYGDASNNIIRGSIVGDTIYGGGGNDIIRGHLGMDFLYGSAGNDIFRYYAFNELEDGEIINGGAGTDKIEIRGGGTYDFRDNGMFGIEEIEFTTIIDSSVYLESSDIGGTGLSLSATIDGNSTQGAKNNLRVYLNSSSVNLSSFNFQDWVEADDHVYIFGRVGANDTIAGSDQDDWIRGFSGNDTLRGHDGKDDLFGEAGNDTFRYYLTNEVEADEYIDGGADTDKIQLRGAGYFDFANASLNSIEEIEFFTNHDNIAAIRSAQLGTGLSATAIIDSHAGAGAENEFRVLVDTASTDLTGLTFQDWVEADDDVVVYGTNGADTVLGTSVGDTMFGYNGNDVFRGFNGDDNLSGGGGNDQLYGGKGNDVVWASSGTNTLAGGKGNDIVNGGNGVDTIYGNVGADWLYGYSGNDVINGGGWVDRVFGGAGNDTIHGNFGNDQLYGEAGDDTITGGYGLDVIHGGSGNDQVYGGGFADELYGNGGSDFISGGGGNDTVNGGSGMDNIHGEGGNDTLYGNGGDDLVFGGAGVDFINGGTGSDRLWGGDGVTDDGTQDRFVFASSIGHDQIHDFENGIDRIDFSGNATFNNFATVSANAVQAGSDVVITQNANNTLRIDDMNLADLDASDFIF